MIFCMKCGSQLPEEAKFCRYCGTSTEVENEGNKVSVPSKHKPDSPVTPQEVETVPAKTDDRPARENSSVPIEKTRKKASSVFVDDEYYGGLAKKNVGGEFVESEDKIVGGKWGVVDYSGKDVVPAIYDQISIFKDGYIKVTLDGNCGILNKKGEEIIPIMYSDTTCVSEGMAGVCLNSKWGFVDLKGKRVIPFKYHAITPFENGMAGVCKNGKWGFVDKKDRIMIPFIYNDISQIESNKKTIARNESSTTKKQKRNSLYQYTTEISKAWAAAIGEAVLLLVMSFMLPSERNATFWSLAIITVIVSFVLFFIIIETIKEKTASRGH